jgi:hypothetical protein
MKKLDPGKARIDLTLRKPSYFLGENVLVDFCVVNVDRVPLTLEVGGDYRGSSRSLRFKIDVRDAKGNPLPDPDPTGYNLGGLGYSPKLKPGEKWCQSLRLARYARIDAPGTYAIRATHDLGWPAGAAPSGTASITYKMPTAADAEEVVAAMEKLPPNPNTTAGNVSPDYADFTGLRYGVYVSSLLKRLRQGKLEAMGGLAEIPTPTATRALVALLADSDPKLAQAAARGLAMRLPDPALTGGLGARNPFENAYSEQRKYLSAAAWVPTLSEDVRAAARKWLDAPEVGIVVQAAFMIEAVGAPPDAPALIRALDVAVDRTRTVPAETDIYPTPRGACMELLRAARILVARGATSAASPSTPGELALWLVALDAGARPQGWEVVLERALQHPIAYVRQLALERAPHPLPVSLEKLVAANLIHADDDVRVAAAQLAAREGLIALAGDVVKAMPKVTGLRLSSVSDAAYRLGARMERLRVLVQMLAAKDTFDEALSELIYVLDCHGESRSGGVPDDARAPLIPLWSHFIAAHEADILAGRKISLDDPSVTADLVPKTWKLGRADGTQWP